MLSLLASLLSNSRFWLIVVLVATNGISYMSGRDAGYEKGHAEFITEQLAFTLFKEHALEAAMAAQVQRDVETAALKVANTKVTEDYVSLQSATGSAVLALDTARMRALSALEAARRRAPSGDTDPGPQPDESAQDRVLRSCFQRYADVGADAQRLSDQVSALQEYVTNVCTHE